MQIKKLILYIISFIVFHSSITFALEDISTFDDFENAVTSEQGDNDITLSKDIEANCDVGCLKKDMTIEGNNHALDGNSNGGIIVEENRNLEMKNFEMKNFNGENGSAVTLNRNSNLNAQNVDFVENSASTLGGAIYNNSNIDFMRGNFKSNHADSEGGAIYNNSNIDTVIGNFIGNTATVNGGAVYNQTQGVIKNIYGNFENNSAITGYAGAVYNFGTIGNIVGNFENNSSSEFGGAIVNLGEIDSILGNFDSNRTTLMGGALYNTGDIKNIEGMFKNNVSDSDMFGGGAIGNFGQIEALRGQFLNNHSNGRGGAIYNSYLSKLNIISDKSDVVFSNNTDSLGNNAIYNENGEINFVLGDYNITFDDEIDGLSDSTSVVNIDSLNDNSGGLSNPSTSGGKIVFNNMVKNNTINMKNGVMEFGFIENASADTGDGSRIYGNFDGSVKFNYYDGLINLQNENIQNTNLGKLELFNDMKLNLEADLKNERMDTLSVDSIQNNGYKIGIENLQILSPTTKQSLALDVIDKNINQDYFELLKKSIEYKGSSLIESPIYRYNVYYNETDGKMYFNIPNDGFERFNPSILKSSVAQQLGGYFNLLNTYDEAFKNMDMYMLLPKNQRLGKNLEDLYASITPIKGEVKGFYRKKYFYFRPYSFFENVPLKSSGAKLKVDNIAYGSFFGIERHYKIKRRYNFVLSPYISYIGSNQHYNFNSIYQNGAMAGLLAMLYKDDFYFGLTVPIGATGCKGKGKIEDDDFSMLMTGIALKTGYNKEFREGRYIVQPNFLFAYSFVDTFNYKNSLQAQIKSHPLHALTICPGIKIIGNFENNFQPYIMVNMVWNILDKTDFSANDVALPYLSTKPFVRYGLGIRKIINDRLDGFLSAYVMNGGRNGVGLFAGLRFEFGSSK